MARISDGSEVKIPEAWQKKLGAWQVSFPAKPRPGPTVETTARPRVPEGSDRIPARKHEAKRAARARTICWIHGAFCGAFIATTAIRMDAWWAGFLALLWVFYATKPWAIGATIHSPPREMHSNHGVLKLGSSSVDETAPTLQEQRLMQETGHSLDAVRQGTMGLT